MPKNTGGYKKHLAKNKTSEISRKLILKDSFTEYARAMKMLGSGRVECYCFSDKQTKMGHIRGKMNKRVWIEVNDILLIAKRDYQSNVVDIVYKYTDSEARQLIKINHINEN